MNKWFFALVFFFTIAMSAFADTITLKDSQKITGKIDGEDAFGVKLKVKGGTIRIPKECIHEIEKEEAKELDNASGIPKVKRPANKEIKEFLKLKDFQFSIPTFKWSKKAKRFIKGKTRAIDCNNCKILKDNIATIEKNIRDLGLNASVVDISDQLPQKVGSYWIDNCSGAIVLVDAKVCYFSETRIRFELLSKRKLQRYPYSFRVITQKEIDEDNKYQIESCKREINSNTRWAKNTRDNKQYKATLKSLKPRLKYLTWRNGKNWKKDCITKTFADSLNDKSIVKLVFCGAALDAMRTQYLRTETCEWYFIGLIEKECEIINSNKNKEKIKTKKDKR